MCHGKNRASGVDSQYTERPGGTGDNLAAARATKPSGRAARIRRLPLVLYCVRCFTGPDVFDDVTGSSNGPRGAGNQLQIGNPRGA